MGMLQRRSIHGKSDRQFTRILQVLHISNLLFLGFSFGCAYSPTAADLIGFRILGELLVKYPSLGFSH